MAQSANSLFNVSKKKALLYFESAPLRMMVRLIGVKRLAVAMDSMLRRDGFECALLVSFMMFSIIAKNMFYFIQCSCFI
jgi:hypothetical protein